MQCVDPVVNALGAELNWAYPVQVPAVVFDMPLDFEESKIQFEVSSTPAVFLRRTPRAFGRACPVKQLTAFAALMDWVNGATKGEAMPTPSSWRGVVGRYQKLPLPQQGYFEHLPKLAEHFPWDVCLAYQFARVGSAHHMTLYCATVKLHRAHPELAWAAVQHHHLNRDNFKTLFAAIVGQPLPKAVTSLITTAENTRDRVMHGKATSESKKRDAVCGVLNYLSRITRS